MKIKVNVNYESTNFKDSEVELIEDIFGIYACDVYFRLDVDIDSEDSKFVNFTGISGSGKTVIKEHLYDEFNKLSMSKPMEYKVLDFDKINLPKDKTIMEVLNIKDSDDEILKIISGFGLFEMRLLFSEIGKLSQGQYKRLQYVYLLNQIEDDKKNFILIDEFLTFVDSLSSIAFAQSFKKYLKDKNVEVYTFGVNDKIVGQFEDVSYVLGNSCLNAIIKNGEIKYVSKS